MHCFLILSLNLEQDGDTAASGGAEGPATLSTLSIVVLMVGAAFVVVAVATLAVAVKVARGGTSSANNKASRSQIITSLPLFFKLAHSLDVSCVVLSPAPTMLWPPTKPRLESRTSKSKPNVVYDRFAGRGGTRARGCRIGQ